MGLKKLKPGVIIKITVAALLTISAPASSRIYSGILADPLVLGAWIYEGKCVSCHGDYDSAHMAEEYDDEAELVEAIGSTGCRISWARKEGGVLGHNEINGLVQFMTAWEEAGERPNLPELPPQPVEVVQVPAKKNRKKQSVNVSDSQKDPLAPELRQVVENNPIAMGGWLYTTNCYRCHLTYDQARMGKGLERESVHRFISEGKTSTQMSPFSRMLGGNLKNSEIRAVVDYVTTWEKAGENLAIASELMTPPALDPSEFIPIRLTRFLDVTGELQSGAELYRSNCSLCHGGAGKGYLGPPLFGFWSLRPDLYLKSTIKKGVPESPMPSWEKGDHRLSAKDIDDLVSYIVGRDSSVDEGSPE